MILCYLFVCPYPSLQLFDVWFEMVYVTFGCDHIEVRHTLICFLDIAPNIRIGFLLLLCLLFR